MQSLEMAELVQKVNAFRAKQIEGGGLTDEEVKEGISCLIQIRKLRGALQMELPGIVKNAVEEKLEDLF